MSTFNTSDGYENGKAAWEAIQVWLLHHFIRRIPQHVDELEGLSKTLQSMWGCSGGPTVHVLTRPVMLFIHGSHTGVEIFAKRGEASFRMKLCDDPVTTGIDTLRTILGELDSKGTIFTIH